MKKAFTLVEILIYMGLMTFFIVILGQVFTSVLDAQADAQKLSSTEVDGRYILSRLTYDVRRSTAVTAPALGATGTNLGLTIGGTTYTYSVVNNQLTLSFSGTTSALTSWDTQIANFSVTTLGNLLGRPTVQISFTISSAEQTQDYLTTVSLR